MNRNALVWAFCGLLFTNILFGASSKDIEKLMGKCALADQVACEKLEAAVGQLTDQALLTKVAVESNDRFVRHTAVGRVTDRTLLAKIAVEAKDADVRNTAVGKLTDQAVLAKVAAEDENSDVRQTAVETLTDQSALAKVAVEDKDANVRVAAVRKLTDQAAAAKIAVEDQEAYVRLAAVEKLTDQAALGKAAVEAQDANVRWLAVGKLTDQALLAKIAVEDKDANVREAAVGKLTDQALLGKIAVEDKDAWVRLIARGKLTDQAALAKIAAGDKDSQGRESASGQVTYQAALAKAAPALRREAGNLGALTEEAGKSMARIKLAIMEPRIRNRLPQIVFAPSRIPVSRSYYGGKMSGELVTFVLSQGGETLAKSNWTTDFPPSTHTFGFRPAKVRGEALLAELLHNAVFTQDDLAELSSAEIPELRLGAIANLTDQALLAKIAVKDRNESVRIFARQRLNDLRENTK
ncbi:MAG: hypothetical protein WAO35_10275 [Terriglobia bacterium]